MMSLILIDIISLLFLFHTVVNAGYHEKRLLHNLLDNYNVLERPVVNESDPLQLSFGLTLMQIIDVVSFFMLQSCRYEKGLHCFDKQDVFYKVELQF